LKRQSREESAELIDRADHARERRKRDGEIRFPSALAAVNWFWECRETLSAPRGVSFQTQRAADGSVTFVRVQGGRRPDFEEVIATATTIGLVLARLQQDYPKPHQALLLTAKDGLSQKKVADMLNVSQATVSMWRSLAEAYLAGALREDVLAVSDRAPAPIELTQST
jgi:DNA-directed RNA polymerase specialized sigma24 family protein